VAAGGFAVPAAGFKPLFEHVQLAERYDLAIMSTKGLSNTARLLVERLLAWTPLYRWEFRRPATSHRRGQPYLCCT
jgi:hypothetical protein